MRTIDYILYILINELMCVQRMRIGVDILHTHSTTPTRPRPLTDEQVRADHDGADEGGLTLTTPKRPQQFRKQHSETEHRTVHYDIRHETRQTHEPSPAAIRRGGLVVHLCVCGCVCMSVWVCVIVV